MKAVFRFITFGKNLVKGFAAFFREDSFSEFIAEHDRRRTLEDIAREKEGQ